MTDYNKQTVANLRQLLKDRGIPSTGLTRKAQIIEKLEEWDTTQSAPAAEKADGTPAAEKEEEQKDAPMQDADAPAVAAEGPEQDTKDDEAKGEEVTQTAPVADSQPQPEADTTISEEPSAPQATEDPAPAPPAPEEPSTSTPAPAEPAIEPSKPSPHSLLSRNRTPSSAPDEKPSIEKAELLPIAERSATTTAEPDTRLNTEELEAETRKRKRRSLTPELPSQDVKLRAKRPRPSDAAPEVVLKEDAIQEGDEADVNVDTVMGERAPEEVEKEVDEKAMEAATNGGENKMDVNVDAVMEQAAPEQEEKEVDEKAMEASMDGEEKREQETEASIPPKEPNDAPPKDDKSPTPKLNSKTQAPEKKDKAPRYKDLFQPSTTDTPMEDALTDDRPIAPALHPATPALYIRNFMRPLRPEALRMHLISLATPPSSSPSPSILKSLFLDNMKTHALVLFASTTAASRVRASLHGSIWPPEGNRKDLWVDFIPDDKVEGWIAEEEAAFQEDKDARASGISGRGKKFEIVYPENEDGTVEAVFQEVGAVGGAVNAGSAAPFNPPTGPRKTSHQTNSNLAPPTHAPAPSSETRHDIEKSFKTLDELFHSTTAKPQLYFLPVSDQRSEARLKELDLETSRDWTPEEKRKGRGMQHSRLDQKVRFGFDEEDRVVEVGGDFGPWTDDFRAGGGRGGFGFGGGGYRGRGRGGGGGGGGNWRGGGGGGGWRSGK
ncbi:hypothetical protein CC80DRAFT_589141 [Byssothecium circinans]|uniref:SAP domain-containing protein n=1 Tax=Byssothecium circinans TaxID=147558 RepID=A0A6A5UKL2_9PLEO|nr:hypothetical protein CC80DRAFT_589141 [Byssothecium circinans]